MLIDVDDVALGHQTRQRWNPPGQWIRSAAPSHPAIVSTELFQTVRDLARGRPTSKPRAPRSTARTYLLRGVLFCGLCQRKMQGNWNHQAPHYRCRFPNEYALANHTEHPLTVYLRESDLVPGLDRWLLKIFEPTNLSHTLDHLVAGQPYGIPIRTQRTRRSASTNAN